MGSSARGDSDGTKDLRKRQDEWLNQLLAKPPAGCRSFELKAGRVLFDKGSVASEVHLILRGRVKIVAVDRHGDRSLVRETAGPMDWLSEETLADEPVVHHYKAVAATHVWLVAFSRATFPALLADHPPLASMFLQGTLKHFVKVQSAFNEQVFASADRRLARQLLAMFDKGSDMQSFPMNATPTNLAELIGVTRQQVHRLISNFTKLGILSKHGREYRLHRAPLMEVLQNETDGKGDSERATCPCT